MIFGDNVCILRLQIYNLLGYRRYLKFWEACGGKGVVNRRKWQVGSIPMCRGPLF